MSKWWVLVILILFLMTALAGMEDRKRIEQLENQVRSMQYELGNRTGG